MKEGKIGTATYCPPCWQPLLQRRHLLASLAFDRAKSCTIAEGQKERRRENGVLSPHAEPEKRFHGPTSGEMPVIPSHHGSRSG